MFVYPQWCIWPQYKNIERSYDLIKLTLEVKDAVIIKPLR